MKVTVNDKNEVIGYVNTGGLRNSLDVDDNNVPTKFKEEFEPRKFVLVNGEVKYNSDYNDEEQLPSEKSNLASDDILRKMVASMQKQVVQSTKLSMQVNKQNALMAKQLVTLNKKIEEVKGETENA
ncbi:TPA: DUF2977 domain-containing protein [Staphylococcus aureus]|nr:DUF2977 domain-containing protein [Staphylococcus aureus]HDC7848902.1 DUF2977 domain-containing protein [Staphylococcus aureus]HEI9076136.1 DUF2977 domain-containing protein [Staphylococcus aureus]